MKLICGAESLSPASQARLILFDGSPGSASVRQGLHSAACWRRLVELLKQHLLTMKG